MITLTVRTRDLWLRFVFLDRKENNKFLTTVFARIFEGGHFYLLSFPMKHIHHFIVRVVLTPGRSFSSAAIS